ncbi:hypothetical protein G6F23_015486 [Rhizopus arrhizus]|nr:hypothetical protein G6F23_015486 [Rhizopus arrhizus]
MAWAMSRGSSGSAGRCGAWSCNQSCQCGCTGSSVLPHRVKPMTTGRPGALSAMALRCCPASVLSTPALPSIRTMAPSAPASRIGQMYEKRSCPGDPYRRKRSPPGRSMSP